MYKFTHHLANAKLVLVRKQLADGSCAALIVMRTPNRRYAQFDSEKCPPPQPGPRKSRKLLWGTLGAALLTGTAVAYAKNSPEARNWLESNFPLANDFVALVYQENTSYVKVATEQFNNLSASVQGLFFGKEGVTPIEVKSRADQNLEEDAAKAFAKKDYQLPPAQFEQFYVEKPQIPVPEVEVPATVVQTEKCDPAQAAPIKISKDVVELEQEMHENTKIAVDSFRKATKQCASYNKALSRLIETPLNQLESKFYTALQGPVKERDTYAKKAKTAAAKAKLAIDTLDRLIQAGVQAPPESLAQTQRFIKKFRADLATAENEYNEELEKAVLSDRYWNKVEEARSMFRDELQALFPFIDLSGRKIEFQGDSDMFLIFVMKQIQYLQNELAELQTVREWKIQKAIDCHDEKALIDAKVEDLLKKEKIALDQELLKKSLIAQAEANKKMKDELRKLCELQNSVLQEQLKKKEQEVLAKSTKSMSEEVEKGKLELKKEIAAMAGKMQAIELSLKQRANAEAEAKRSQSLWVAAEALLAATRRGTPHTSVETELSALEKVGQGDILVNAIVHGIPHDIREKGIVPERALMLKFDQMEKTALKVALVGREGASLPVYFLSWLQTKFIFQRFSEIPKDELNDLPTDFSELDTFDIMYRARYFMDRGNLPAALKYVNLLQGASRAASLTWCDEARRYLEVKQAAEAIMAHASVSGLLN